MVRFAPYVRTVEGYIERRSYAVFNSPDGCATPYVYEEELAGWPESKVYGRARKVRVLDLRRLGVVQIRPLQGINRCKRHRLPKETLPADIKATLKACGKILPGHFTHQASRNLFGQLVKKPPLSGKNPANGFRNIEPLGTVDFRKGLNFARTLRPFHAELV